jgi:hypothetical protein
VELGSAGEWAGALGSIAAVAVALWLAISDARRRDSDRREEKAAQARLITVEVETIYGKAAAFVTVTNHSASPVFSVAINGVQVSPEPPAFVQFGEDRQWARLDPGQMKTARCAFFSSRNPRDLWIVSPPNLVSAEVSFVDASGLPWKRWGNTPPRLGGPPIGHREPPTPVEELS